MCILLAALLHWSSLAIEYFYYRYSNSILFFAPSHNEVESIMKVRLYFIVASLSGRLRLQSSYISSIQDNFEFIQPGLKGSFVLLNCRSLWAHRLQLEIILYWTNIWWFRLKPVRQQHNILIFSSTQSQLYFLWPMESYWVILNFFSWLYSIVNLILF